VKTSGERRRASLALVVGVVAVVTLSGFFRLVDPSLEDGAAEPSPTSAPNATTASPPTSSIDAFRRPGWIEEENARQGTTDWHIPDDRVMWDKISGFADTTSIDADGSFSLYVSTGAPSWQVSAYRIGYYGGSGGRLVWRSEPQPGALQPPPMIDPVTRTGTAPWPASLTVDTDLTWPPGQYLMRLESSDGGATFVPLVIRDDGSRSDLLVQSAVTTWQAYNGWGGASLYQGSKGRADVVTFDRPYTGNGSGEFLGREFEFIYLAERLGLDLSYWTDIDLHERGELALNHRGVVIPGHDEYYTVEMRLALERARDSGVNLGFFGANNIYRRIRLEPSGVGANRHQVNYRDASRDPLNGEDPARVTTGFREAPAANPESALVGNYYECNPVSADWVVGDSSVWMFEGSGFVDGERIADMVGNEYDRVTPGVPTPANIQILAHSPLTCGGRSSFANSTWYSAPSGAGVFSAGTFGWSPLLDAECPLGPLTTGECKLVKVTENLLRAFAAGPAGAAHPSVSNLQRFGLRVPAPTSTTLAIPTTTTFP
jgi:hypothetical protein